MSDRLRNLLYPLTLFVMVAILWAYAHSESVGGSGTNWLPPADPDLFERIRADELPGPSGSTESFARLDPLP